MRTIQRQIVGAFIFSNDNKILLGYSGVYKEQLVVPGGGIEEGETLLEATRREVLEETGVDINSGTITHIPGSSSGESEKVLRDTGERVLVQMTFYDHEVRMPDNAEDIVVRSADDFHDAGWYSKEDLATKKLGAPTQALLQKLRFL